MKLILTFLIFLLLFLTGCGTPKNSEFAIMGFFGVSIIFLVSSFTLFFYSYFRNKKKGKFIKEFKNFWKNHKLLIWILVVLLIPTILPVGWIVGLFLLVFASIPTALYSLIVLWIFRKKEKYQYLTPIIITILYVLTLLYVARYDHGHDLGKSILIIWIWPVLIVGYIVKVFDLWR